MKYIVVAGFLWPLLRAIRFFRPCAPDRVLLIQTAKIGDWVNSTPLVRRLAPVDVVCDPTIVPLVSRDAGVGRYYVLPGRSSLRYKLRILRQLFLANYKQIFVLMPNMPNTFLARLACAAEVRTIDTYRSRLLVRWLGFGFRRYRHGRSQLALDSYLRLVDHSSDAAVRQKHATLPLYVPDDQLILREKKFRVGVSLSAGNALKTMPTAVWTRLFSLLKDYDCDIYIFGLDIERRYLDALKEGLPAGGLPTIVDCLGNIPLEALPWHIAQMHLYISTDTGNSYIADSQNVPVVNFSGPCCAAEQRPIGSRVLIIETEGLRPFSFVFETRYESDISPEVLYAISEGQWKVIREFIGDCRRVALGLD